ncbi:MAG TPA: hypothetical protein VFN65_07525 [Solirubrobacteraceae bacterium]|nr:hypothetical protein [Solirubrobacteraceae bacterium]
MIAGVVHAHVHLSSWWQVVLAAHLASVVIGFGIVFAAPLFLTVGTRLDPLSMVWFHQMQQAVSRRIVSPALVFLVIFGVALASKLDAWGTFYVQWGIGVSIVIGALEGMVLIPRAGRLADLARRDVGGHGAPVGAPRALSAEYHGIRRQMLVVSALISLLVLATIVIMALHVRG